MTAGDIISSALRLVGSLASGEALSANESSDALNSLNDLLDSWSTQNLLIPNKGREVFALTPGQQSYTMGTGGNFNTTRPMRIEQALIQFGSPVIELPIKIITKDEYARIILKTLQSTIPMYLYPEGTSPLETIDLWPVPNTACNLVLYSWKPLATLATLATAVSLPPGYQRALRYNLALDLAPEYGREIPAVVAQIAMESKGEIKRMNAKPVYLQVDDSLLAKPAVWNWMTGDPA